ncbi:hypothetical protein [Glaciimonas immobilis]|uniref:Uncharacterized protein n=1 Tax=Glaciimonas immobilis TaxID=728004 RepID=A0A840RSZ7_9BURK|nr:hypothetical protein [Glaciimonas immobilis]MBB5200935.1 hypothetical protein [Glaciimonas immobilis]
MMRSEFSAKASHSKATDLTTSPQGPVVGSLQFSAVFINNLAIKDKNRQNPLFVSNFSL